MGALLLTWFDLNPSIDELLHPLLHMWLNDLIPTFKGCTVQFCEWIANFTPHFTGHVTIDPRWVKVNPCKWWNPWRAANYIHSIIQAQLGSFGLDLFYTWNKASVIHLDSHSKFLLFLCLQTHWCDTKITSLTTVSVITSVHEWCIQFTVHL